MHKPAPKRALLDHVDTFSDSSEEETGHPSLLTQLKMSLNPPAVALFVALPIAMLTTIKAVLFLNSDAIFHDNVYAAINKIGNTTSVLILISLGSTLSRGYPPNCDITK
jgi:predicted permease